MPGMAERKSNFRKEMLASRANIPPQDRAEADRKIFKYISSLPEYENARAVFCYVSVTDEPDTEMLIKDALGRGKRVCVPRCESMGTMFACEIESRADLQAGKYDIPEPMAHCGIVSPKEIDLIITPCVCCDRSGYRLGYGGGFYDRWLENRSMPAAVLCFESMMVKSVPTEAHDQCADIVVTDKTVYDFRGGSPMHAGF